MSTPASRPDPVSPLVQRLVASSGTVFALLLIVLGEAERGARGFTRGGYIVLAAGTAGIAGLTVAIGLSAAATATPDTPPEVLKALNDFASGAWLLAAPAFGACLVTAGLLNAGVRALPAW